MKKYYSEPELEIRKYSFNPSDSVFTNSTPEVDDGSGLEKDDGYNGDDIFGNN